MIEEMLIESAPWESGESEDSESEDAFAESGESEDSEDSVEDTGESRRRRRMRGQYAPGPGRLYSPGRGVRGMVVRGPDGRARNLPFPRPVATAAETNRGLARQEIGRRALQARLNRLETRLRAQPKRDGSIAGGVTLAVGGGLTAFSLIKASQQAAGESLLQAWVKQPTATTATVASVSQIATTGARLLVDGRYHRSSLGIAADVFAAAQIAVFAFGSLRTPDVLEETDDVTKDPADKFSANIHVFDKLSGKIFKVVQTRFGKHFVPV